MKNHGAMYNVNDLKIIERKLNIILKRMKMNLLYTNLKIISNSLQKGLETLERYYGMNLEQKSGI